MLGSRVGQYSTSHAMVRVSSTAKCCASGARLMMRSKELSSSSSKLFGRWRSIEMPISSMAATAKGSSAPVRTPTDSTKMRGCQRCLRIASAMGERIELRLQAKSTLEGSPPPALPADMQDAQQREEASRGREIDGDLVGKPLSQELRALVVEGAAPHVDRLDAGGAG